MSNKSIFARFLPLFKYYLNKGKALINNLLMKFLDVALQNKNEFFIKKVSNSFYRSPDASKHMSEVAKKGIKIVLNLKTISSEQVEILTKEAKKFGIEYVNIPINPLNIKKSVRPIYEVIKKASPENPLLVHCTFGKDRTGFVTALYRHFKEEMPIKEAISDMYENGFRRIFFPLDNYLKKLNLAEIKNRN